MSGLSKVSHVAKILDLKNLKVGDPIISEETDLFSSFETSDDRIIYVTTKREMSAGVFSLVVQDHSLALVPLNIKTDRNMDMPTTTALVEKTRNFLAKSHIYKERDIACRRATLLYGKPGNGKTHSINNAVKELSDANTLSISISMDNVSIGSVISLFEYYKPAPNIDKVFIIIEDLGGGEEEPGARKTVDSSVLSFLDGTRGSWDLPTVIFATTNYPENLLENLINRPGRFDEVVEVPPPSASVIWEYMQTLLGRALTNEEKYYITEGASLAHAKEAVIRLLVYDISIERYFSDLRAHQNNIANEFRKNVNRMGL